MNLTDGFEAIFSAIYTFTIAFIAVSLNRYMEVHDGKCDHKDCYTENDYDVTMETPFYRHTCKKCGNEKIVYPPKGRGRPRKRANSNSGN